MSSFINIGYGNLLNSDKIVVILNPDSAPVKRMVQNAKDTNTALDATQGRKTRAVIVTDNSHIVLSALAPDTIGYRINETMKG